MSVFAKKLLGVSLAVAALGALIGLYVAAWATSAPPPVAAVAAPASSGGADLTLETVAAIGPKYSPTHPDWVSYLVRENGKWVHSTNFTVPANSTVHVTLYQYDGDTGLRNPLLSQVQGTVGGTETIDGKAVDAIDPEEASHTFVVPQLGVFVPLPGVPEEAKNQCEFAPCEGAAHRTIEFSFHTGKKGRYRWQCFVPCAAGYLYGLGGPMQTYGYMDGFLNVV
ncbi:MAG TPA: hypothetical protein VK790_03175 [Solirubrobacteraceae bacterium]|nr:hypothetical protein [Solirubrobacteraceae bacterium]